MSSSASSGVAAIVSVIQQPIPSADLYLCGTTDNATGDNIINMYLVPVGHWDDVLIIVHRPPSRGR